MKKIDKVQYVFFTTVALISSIMILNSMLAYNWLSITIVVILGVLNFAIEFIISKTFENEFVFFNRLKEQAHPFAQKIWGFGKNIAILLFIQFFGIDFISSYFSRYENSQINTSRLLFDCVLVVICISAIASILSVGFKSVFSKKFKKVKSKKYHYEIEVPNHWNQEKQDTAPNAILTVTNKISDECLFLFYDSKSGYSHDAGLKDYIDIVKDNMYNIPNVNVNSFERLAGRIDSASILIEMKSLIKKKKYKSLLGFGESKDTFYYCIIIAPERTYIENLSDYVTIAESLNV